jgi:hypothetical protein
MGPPTANLSIRKRRAETPPTGSSEPVQKAPRMHQPDSPTGHRQLPPPSSAASNLPIELWMQIFESLSHSDHFARPAYVNCFTKSIIRERATEAQLVPELPAFEREAWLATRPYYAINRTSRQAAHQIFLSGVLLQTCTSPLNQVPLKRNRGRREPRTPRTSIPPPFYAASALARMRPTSIATASGTGTAPEPTYMPLELFDYRLFRDYSHAGRDPELQTPILMLARVDFMMKLFDEHYEGLTPAETTLLRTVRRVDLLAMAPYEHLMGSGAKLAKLIGKTIERMWRELGVEGGVVRVLH